MAPHNLSFRIQHKIFFADKSSDIFEGAPIWVNIYMAGHIYENIITTLLFTDLRITSFKDKFFGVLHIIVAYNQHIKDVFIIS